MIPTVDDITKTEAMPHVAFEVRPIEDREATQKAGRKIMKDQEFMKIYPRGGKDMVRKKLPDEKTPEGYPNPAYQAFMDRYGKHYEAWKQGQEGPVEGTNINRFPLLSPAEIENCKAFHILSVEQLAAANEETLKNLGMGSRRWKMEAQKWLEFGDDGGKAVLEIEDLKEKNRDLMDKLEAITKEIETLKQKKPRGRPKGT